MKRYQCSSCGKISETEKEICKPVVGISTLYVCSECDKKGTDSEAICNPVEMKPEFFCGKCGTSSVMEKKLCEPLSL